MNYNFEEWYSFDHGTWSKEINVRSFIRHNYTPYDGNEDFLVGPTKRTKELWDQVLELTRKERDAGGVLDMDTDVISTITSHGPGYLDKDKEINDFIAPIEASLRKAGFRFEIKKSAYLK